MESFNIFKKCIEFYLTAFHKELPYFKIKQLINYNNYKDEIAHDS